MIIGQQGAKRDGVREQRIAKVVELTPPGKVIDELPLGTSGGLITDRRMRIPGHAGVWAGGDCVEIVNRVSQQRMHIPLGTHANKHGRVIGINLAGGYATSLEHQAAILSALGREAEARAARDKAAALRSK